MKVPTGPFQIRKVMTMVSLEKLAIAYDIGFTRTFHGRLDVEATFPTMLERLAYNVGSLDAHYLQYNPIK